MPGFDVDGLDFADEIRGDAPRAHRGLLLAAVVLVVVALACIGMAFAVPRHKVTACAGLDVAGWRS